MMIIGCPYKDHKSRCRDRSNQQSVIFIRCPLENLGRNNTQFTGQFNNVGSALSIAAAKATEREQTI